MTGPHEILQPSILIKLVWQLNLTQKNRKLAVKFRWASCPGSHASRITWSRYETNIYSFQMTGCIDQIMKGDTKKKKNQPKTKQLKLVLGERIFM